MRIENRHVDAHYTALVYLAAGVLLAPFALYHLLLGRGLMAAVVGVTSIAFLALAGWIRSQDRDPVILNAFLAAVAITSVLVAIYQLGLPGVYWLFPLVLVSYLLFSIRVAACVNLLFMATALPVVVLIADTEHVMRIISTLFLTSCFTFLFAHNLQSSKRELERLAVIDPLTEVGNRRAMERELGEAVYLRKRYRSPAALVVMDIDHFKALNDQHGHPLGDSVLVELMDLCSRELRRSDRVFRYGGEEFVLLLSATSLDSAVAAAEKLRNRIEENSFAGGHRLTISLGVAELATGESWDDWLRRADAALYQAKAAGRNRVVADRSAPGQLQAAIS